MSPELFFAVLLAKEDSKICFKGKNNKIIRVLDNTEELVTRIENGKFTN